MKIIKELCADYKSRMYVSKEDKDWLISDYEGGISINKYLGKDKEIVIPETLDGKKYCGWILITQNNPVIHGVMMALTHTIITIVLLIIRI